MIRGGRNIVTRKAAAGLLLLYGLIATASIVQAQSISSQLLVASSEMDVKRALKEFDASTEVRLDAVENFAVIEPTSSGHYTHASYRFRIETEPVGTSQTRVQIEARITAWYNDPAETSSGYVALPSNGRLEREFFDRLDRSLQHRPVGMAQGLSSITEQIAQTHALLKASDERQAKLEAEIQTLEQAVQAQSSTAKFISIPRAGVPVMDAPSARPHILFRAAPEDEFEVLARRGSWVQIRTGAAGTAWVAAADLEPEAEGELARKSPFSPLDEAGGYEFVREEIRAFPSGSSELRDKQTLFVWVRPMSPGMDRAGSAGRWRYALRIFLERSRVAAFSPQPYFGVAVIFDEPEGGVSAASLASIDRWLNGKIPEATFAKSCSLDPPEAFQQASRPQLRLSPTTGHAYMASSKVSQRSQEQ
jgi:hypothetical protein